MCCSRRVQAVLSILVELCWAILFQFGAVGVLLVVARPVVILAGLMVMPVAAAAARVVAEATAARLPR